MQSIDAEERNNQAALASSVVPLEFRLIHANLPEEEEAQEEHAEIASSPDLEAIAEKARCEGRQQGLQESIQQFEEQRSAERAGVAQVIQGFALERDRYFERVEHEVVRLALAIAERVLHREAKMDPLLLAGAAKVALGKLAESSGAVLRVPLHEKEAWEREMQREFDPIEVRGDSSLDSGECILETRMGTVDLGVRTQLQEIERGFFDLLSRRPAVGA